MHGVELELQSDCDVQWVDDSFDHEFGREQCGHAEVETIDTVELDGDLQEQMEDAFFWMYRPHNRRKWLKWKRRIRRAVEALDPDTFWTQKQLYEAVEDWEPPEPDYD